MTSPARRARAASDPMHAAAAAAAAAPASARLAATAAPAAAERRTVVTPRPRSQTARGHNVTPRRRTRVASALVVAGVLTALAIPSVSGPTASAGTARAHQVVPMPASLAATAVPDFTTRDVAFFAEALGLDDAQRAAVTGILEDYGAAFIDGRDRFRADLRTARPEAIDPSVEAQAYQEAMRRRMQGVIDTARREALAASSDEDAAQILADAETELAELRQQMVERLEDFGPEVAGRAATATLMNRMRDLADAWAATRTELRRVVLARIQAELDETQLTRWPAVERALLRRTLPRGRLTGEKVDLGAILDGVLPPDDVAALDESVRARIDAARAAWERDLHANLERRERDLPSVDAAIGRATPDDDAATMGRLARSRVALHQGVRDANLAGIERLVTALPAEFARPFRAAVERRMFPTLARETPTEALLDAAIARDDLTANERTIVDQVRLDYLERLVAIDARIRALTIDEEPAALVDQVVRPSGLGAPAPVSPLVGVHRARRELGDSVGRDLLDVLGPSRFAELPYARRFMRR